MRDFGIDRTAFRDINGEISPACDISMKGYGMTMSEISSYIGYSQMDDIPLLLMKQYNNACHWKKNFLLQLRYGVKMYSRIIGFLVYYQIIK